MHLYKVLQYSLLEIWFALFLVNFTHQYQQEWINMKVKLIASSLSLHLLRYVLVHGIVQSIYGGRMNLM